MQVVWLKGDYLGKHQRQRQALQSSCDIVISFHFNSSKDKTAAGAEVYHNGKNNVVKLAQQLLSAIVEVLKVPKRKVENAKGSRAGFICHYHCPAVLIEPCFVSNPDEAKLLHDINIMRRLGERIAVEVKKWFKDKTAVVVGLDVGHMFKNSSPHDKGAKCVLGDTEGDHAEVLAKIVAAALTRKEGEKVGANRTG